MYQVLHIGKNPLKPTQSQTAHRGEISTKPE